MVSGGSFSQRRANHETLFPHHFVEPGAGRRGRSAAGLEGLLCRRAGWNFTDLPPAVAAASPGDTILVYNISGQCAALYTATTIDKPLRIVGFHLQPPHPPGPTWTSFQGVFTIIGIPAGQQVLLSNIGIVNAVQLPLPQHGVEVLNCAGDVVLEHVQYGHGGLTNSIVRIENCANVILRGCDIETSGTPLRVINSTLLLTNTVLWNYPPAAGPSAYTMSTESLRLTNSTVTMVGSYVEGAWQTWNWPARPAAVIESGVLRVGPQSLLRGGPNLGPPLFYFVPAYTLVNPAVGSLQQDPRSIIMPLGVSAPTQTDIYAVYHSWVVANEPFGVTVVGPLGGFALLALSNMIAPVPTPFGDLVLDPTALTILDLVALHQPNGEHQWTFVCPPTAPVGFAFAFQALTLAPNGAFGLTVPSPLTVGWPQGVIP